MTKNSRDKRVIMRVLKHAAEGSLAYKDGYYYFVDSRTFIVNRFHDKTYKIKYYKLLQDDKEK